MRIKHYKIKLLKGTKTMTFLDFLHHYINPLNLLGFLHRQGFDLKTLKEIIPIYEENFFVFFN